MEIKKLLCFPYIVLVVFEFIAGLVSILIHKPTLYVYLLLNKIKRGNGELIVCIPGFGANDLTMWLMAQSLRSLGYNASTWGLGFNNGRIFDRERYIVPVLELLSALHNQKVTLVGSSLGGVDARYLATKYPHLIRQIITLGSPTQHNPVHNFLPEWFKEWLHKQIQHDLTNGIQVIPEEIPITAVRGALDCIVFGDNAFFPEDVVKESDQLENTTVKTSHYGLVSSIPVLKIITDRI